MALQFTKMSGTGNDFIVVDNRAGVLSSAPAAFARTCCERRKGIGADGVILIEPSAAADFRMRIFNPDGSEAEMCGNGARCAARFAARHGIAGETMRFETLSGIIEAQVAGDDVTIGMGEVPALAPPADLAVQGRTVTVHPIEAGVPHAIIFVDDVSAVEVDAMGAAVRKHPFFHPRGSNVDFVQVIGPASVRIRTYERGVEAETLACGTGAIGSAVVSHVRKDVGGPPVQVRVQGGRLSVDFRMEDGRVRDVRLTGDAVFVYEAKMLEGKP